MAFAGCVSHALADGAFPDSGQVLLPPDRPGEITLGTNFGLIETTDGGKTWDYTCETALTTSGQAYQLGLSRDGRAGRVVASSLWGVVYSDDASCSFVGANGDIVETVVTDLFVDRIHPERVFAIGYDDGTSAAPADKAFRSTDGGTTFEPAIFVAPGDAALLGIEGASSDPETIYLTMRSTGPALVRTTDGGGHWDIVDLDPVLGDAFVRIIAVDPSDPRKIFLRASSGTMGDRLVVSADGGASFATPLAVDGGLTAFVQRSNGTILLTGIASNQTSFGARSVDGGSTFEPWSNVPHVRAMAERDGLLYVAADNVADGFALAVSSDEGSSWRSLLAYRDVTRIRPCVATACLEACRSKVQAGLWGPSVCGDSGGTPVEAGTDGPSAPSVDAGRGFTAKPVGCSLSSTGRGRSATGSLLLALVGLLLLGRAAPLRPAHGRSPRRPRPVAMPPGAVAARR
jgi:hypothetical protein